MSIESEWPNESAVIVSLVIILISLAIFLGVAFYVPEDEGVGGRGVRMEDLCLPTGLNVSSARRCEFESPSCL